MSTASSWLSEEACFPGAQSGKAEEEDVERKNNNKISAEDPTTLYETLLQNHQLATLPGNATGLHFKLIPLL
jgi:hypothetical protein